MVAPTIAPTGTGAFDCGGLSEAWRKGSQRLAKIGLEKVGQGLTVGCDGPEAVDASAIPSALAWKLPKPEAWPLITPTIPV
jgi:hypothetical protein